jgi:hypothetical protein
MTDGAGQRLPYVQSIAGCLPAAIGDHGLSEAELAATLAKLAPHLGRLADDERLGKRRCSASQHR